jgi:hypothetical protein
MSVDKTGNIRRRKALLSADSSCQNELNFLPASYGLQRKRLFEQLSKLRILDVLNAPLKL